MVNVQLGYVPRAGPGRLLEGDVPAGDRERANNLLAGGKIQDSTERHQFLALIGFVTWTTSVVVVDPHTKLLREAELKPVPSETETG